MVTCPIPKDSKALSRVLLLQILQKLNGGLRVAFSVGFDQALISAVIQGYMRRFAVGAR